MRQRRFLVGVVVALAAVGCWSAAASAHITPDPETAPKGAGDQEIAFRVPNEEATANTNSVQIQMPQDHPIAAVDVLDVPGWTATVATRKLAKPIKTDDGEFTEVADVVTWKGGKIAPGHYGDFKILAMGLPSDTDSLTFKTIQGYDDGKNVAWIETDPSSQHPAPVVKLTAAAAAGDTPAATPTTAAATPAKSSSSGSSSDNSSNGLAIAALVVGGIALVVGVGAIVMGRRNSSSPA